VRVDAFLANYGFSVRNGQFRSRSSRVAKFQAKRTYEELATAADCAKTLIQREAPERSILGIAIAVASLIVMPWLASEKRKTARNLSSAALRADSKQTSLCAYLSFILLAGLLLNALLGWWWADPISGLCMVPIIINEGREALHGKTCSDCRS